MAGALWSLASFAHASTASSRTLGTWDSVHKPPEVVESFDAGRGGSIDLAGRVPKLWAPPGAVEVSEYLTVSLREALALRASGWAHGRTLGELKRLLTAALFEAEPLLSPGRTQIEVRLLVPFEVAMARPGQAQAS